MIKNKDKVGYSKSSIRFIIFILIIIILISSPVNAKIIDFTDPRNIINMISNGTLSLNGSMVINGKIGIGFTPWGLRQFLKGENATLENITAEEALKLNISDWINYDNQYYKIVRLKKEYIENISVALNGTLRNFQPGEYYSNVKIEIEVNESAIIKAHPTDNSVLANLTLNYDGKSTTIEYDYIKHKYVFEGVLSLRGNGWLYPLDKYASEIQVNGGEGELFEKHQSFESQESGFNLDVYFKKDKIQIERSRSILSRYFISLLVLIFSIIILNQYINNLNISQLNDRKMEIIFGGIFGTLGFALLLGFENLNFIMSIGILPFVIYLLILFYKYFEVSNQHSQLIPLLKNENIEKKSKKSHRIKNEKGYSNKKSTSSKKKS